MATDSTRVPNHRQYRQAPITEAVIELLVLREPDGGVEVLAPLADAWSGRFPKHEAQMQADFVMKIESTPTSQQTIKQVGVRFFDTAGLQVVQARMNGFAFAQLAPYRGWQDFFEQASSLWPTYVSVSGAREVQRVSVRYINRIDIPLPIPDIRSYLPVFPDLPQGMPQLVEGFFQQLRLSDEVNAATIVVNHARVESSKAGHASFILDIDVAVACSLDPKSDEIWRKAELVHEIENRTFESCITDLLREVIS